MRPKTSNVQFFLVCHFGISNKEALKMIESGRVSLNGSTPNPKAGIDDEDELVVDHQVLKPKKQFRYFLYHKPVGVECTMNPQIENNLIQATNLSQDFFPLGRLDKDSEGLVLMTNDGLLYQSVVKPDQKIEKVYRVEVDRFIDDNFLKSMSDGVEILGKITIPCKLRKLTDNSFEITLTEGKNRQIRRMCHKFGFRVKRLVRIKIGNFELGDLKCGDMLEITDINA
ncbi:MAG: pseudouridine synthase [Cytophagales bacterium]